MLPSFPSLLDLLMLSRVPSREESLTTCLRNAQEWVNSQLGMIHGKPYLSSSFSLALPYCMQSCIISFFEDHSAVSEGVP